MQFELKTPKHYDLLASVHSWIYPDIQPVPEITRLTIFGRVYEIDRELIPLIIEQVRPGSKVSANYPSGEVRLEKVRMKLNEVLGLNIRMAGALRIIRRDSVLSHIASKVSGIQPYLSPSVFEGLVKTIIQQQISYRAANIITKKIVLKLSQNVHYGNLSLYTFPTPQDILNCGTKGLQEFGLGYKSEYIYEVSKSVDDGTLSLEELKGKSYNEISEILTSIRGIGPWTVGMLAIAGLGDYTVFPVDDLGVRNLLGRLFNKSRTKMTTKEVEDLAGRWGKDWPLVMYLLMCADVLGYLGKDGRQQMHKRTSRKEPNRESG